jgi:hypothetical protein
MPNGPPATAQTPTGWDDQFAGPRGSAFMGWLLPVAKPQGSRLIALGVARRKVVPKFDRALKSALCSRWQHGLPRGRTSPVPRGPV